MPPQACVVSLILFIAKWQLFLVLTFISLYFRNPWLQKKYGRAFYLYQKIRDTESSG